MQGCVRRLEGGLRHQSVGTLVTSAEPRVERPWIHLVSRLPFHPHKIMIRRIRMEVIMSEDKWKKWKIMLIIGVFLFDSNDYIVRKTTLNFYILRFKTIFICPATFVRYMYFLLLLLLFFDYRAELYIFFFCLLRLPFKNRSKSIDSSIIVSL